MKSGFCQIQIVKKYHYKTTFNAPFGHYEWNVMPFGLKNAPFKFQNIMNEIFYFYLDCLIVCQGQWFKFISFQDKSLPKTKISFVRHHIYQGAITSIQRVIQFVDKFPNKVKYKK